MEVVEPVQTVEVLTIYVWNGQGVIHDRVRVSVQRAPKYGFMIDSSSVCEGPIECARRVEDALWAYTHGGVIGLAAAMAAQPAAWQAEETRLDAF